jgi:hypothetical protein
VVALFLLAGLALFGLMFASAACSHCLLRWRHHVLALLVILLALLLVGMLAQLW